MGLAVATSEPDSQITLSSAGLGWEIKPGVEVVSELGGCFRWPQCGVEFGRSITSFRYMLPEHNPGCQSARIVSGCALAQAHDLLLERI